MGFAVYHIVALVLTLPAVSTQPDPQVARNQSNRQTARNDADDDSREHMTAEDVLKELQRQRPENWIIPPASASTRSDDATKPALFPEGYTIVDRTGSLVRDGRWWAFVFDDQADLPPMKVLPNTILEPMVQTATGMNRLITFQISGEMTVFGGRNYLLPRFAFAITNLQETTPRPLQKKSHDAPISTDGDVEDVLKRLQAERPDQEPISMAAISPAMAPEDPPSVRPMLIPDGSAIVERPGRLVQDGDWWTFVFESDHSDHPEPPMKLLPNKSLEGMVDVHRRGVNGLVWIVSGQTTAFENENYLLVRNARRQIVSGNLSK